jgi:hypothetical protein
MSPNFAYLAGLIDGEGTLSLHQASNGRRTWKPVMVMGMCDQTALRLLVTWFPKSHLTFRLRKAPKRSFYLWSVTQKAEIYKILQRVFPYLQTKKPQAKLLLDFLTQYGENYNKRYGRAGTPRNILNAMAKFGTKIRKLNKRGV